MKFVDINYNEIEPLNENINTNIGDLVVVKSSLLAYKVVGVVRANITYIVCVKLTENDINYWEGIKKKWIKKD